MSSTFASRLKALRKQHKLMQKDIADKLGISESAYGFYEQGRREPSLDTINQLSDIFNVSVDYLVNGTSDAVPRESTDYEKRTGSFVISEQQNVYSPSKQLTKDELLQELTDDPDDLYFLDGYLDASEEEKKELRRHFMDIKRQMRDNHIKQASPMSLRDFNEKIKKPD